MRSGWSGTSKQIKWSLLFGAVLWALSGCGDGSADTKEGFYTCQGFRDWWRIPLIYPYHLIMIDSFERGFLEKYDPESLIADRRGEVLLTDITETGFSGSYLIFRRQDSFYLLNIFTAQMQHFQTGKEYYAFLASKGIPVPELTGLQELYTLRWQELDRALKQQHPGFFTPSSKQSCKRVPLRLPWQLVFDGKSAYIGKFDPVCKKWGKWIDRIDAIGIERSFALFKTSDKKTGILIYASGKVICFSSEAQLKEFIGRNFPGSSCPAVVNVEKFHDLVWQAIEKKGN